LIVVDEIGKMECLKVELHLSGDHYRPKKKRGVPPCTPLL
jgi:hypothetical protein